MKKREPLQYISLFHGKAGLTYWYIQTTFPELFALNNAFNKIWVIVNKKFYSVKISMVGIQTMF